MNPAPSILFKKIRFAHSTDEHRLQVNLDVISQDDHRYLRSSVSFHL